MIRRVLVAALLPLVAGGCALEGTVGIRVSGTSPAVVTESASPELVPHRVAGVTRRARQVVRVDCSITLTYDVREATGTAVLVQTYAAHLRTPRLARGTRYALDCLGSLILELPASASGIDAAAIGADGARTALPVRAPVAFVPIAFRKRLRPEAGTQLALVEWPAALPQGDYHVELSFSLPDARPFVQKALYTASISCGRARYLEPVLPPVTAMAQAPSLAVRPSTEPVALALPHVARGIQSYVQATRRLSC